MKIKQLTALFGVGLAGIVVCLIMTIYTGVQEHRQKELKKSEPLTIPVPALEPSGS